MRAVNSKIKLCHAQFIYGLNKTGQSIVYSGGSGVSSLAGVVSPAGVGVLIFFWRARQLMSCLHSNLRPST